jgi:hypothetical protein
MAVELGHPVKSSVTSRHVALTHVARMLNSGSFCYVRKAGRRFGFLQVSFCVMSTGG